MPILRHRGPTVKPRCPTRSLRVELAHADSPPFLRCTVSDGGKATTFFVLELDAPVGRAFLVRDPRRHDDYTCTQTDDGASCTCPGFVRRGHCRHGRGLRKAIQTGLLRFDGTAVTPA